MTTWVISPTAQTELTAILDHIADQSGSYITTARVQAEFLTAFDRLAASPHMGKIRPDLTGKAMRWWRVHSYLVIYDPDRSPIRIVRIVHGARLMDSRGTRTRSAARAPAIAPPVFQA